MVEEKRVDFDEVQSKIYDKFQGSLLFSAVGDALGWPLEFTFHRVKYDNVLDDFISWKKLIGGRYWGYEDTIEKGSYSDDTQLTLAMARCISNDGTFDIDKFAYLELPLWLTYQRGGGRTLKTAAKKILRKSIKNPIFNFFQQKREQFTLDYCDAGANGSAMRILPLALINSSNGNTDRLLKDCWYSTLVTHGHPRAILGTIIYSFLIRRFIEGEFSSFQEINNYVSAVIKKADFPLTTDPNLTKWKIQWNRTNLKQQNFDREFSNAQKEAKSYLEKIVEMLKSDSREFYHRLGALGQYKGSGLSTVISALYLFIKYIENAEEGLIESANMIGSDTDTISYFLGGLFGSFYGKSVIPKRFLQNIQDHKYLVNVANKLGDIALGNTPQTEMAITGIDLKSAIDLIDIWEIEMRDLFWDVLNVNDHMIHPLLGEGFLKRKEEKQIRMKDYVAKLIDIIFKSGQSCSFHSRVKNNGEISESLIPYIKSIKKMRNNLSHKSLNEFL